MKGSNGQKTCWYSAPWPPMHYRIILEPLDVHENAQCEVYVQDRVRSTHIYKNLVQMGNIRHIYSLQEVHIHHEQYMVALCSTLKKPKLFLSRNVIDIHVNVYMKDLVMASQASHDIQPMLDAYSCVMYLCDYVTKALEDLRTLIAEACKEAKDGNMTLKLTSPHGKHICKLL